MASNKKSFTCAVKEYNHSGYYLEIWGNNIYNDPRFSEKETDMYGDPCLTEGEIEMIDLEYEDFVNTLEQKFDNAEVEADDQYY